MECEILQNVSTWTVSQLGPSSLSHPYCNGKLNRNSPAPSIAPANKSNQHHCAKRSARMSVQNKADQCFQTTEIDRQTKSPPGTSFCLRPSPPVSACLSKFKKKKLRLSVEALASLSKSHSPRPNVSISASLAPFFIP